MTASELSCFQIFLILLGIFFVILNASVYFLIPTFALIAVLFFVRHYYLPTSRSLKRLEGVSKYCRTIRAGQTIKHGPFQLEVQLLAI